MAGQGKYTIYAPVSSEKNILLGKLFSKGPVSDYVGQEVDYRNIVVGQGNSFLKKGLQAGDSYFGNGVNMDYSGAPDILMGADGAWNESGDPANSFSPDLSSPGPGKTDGTDKSVNPELKSSDIKPNYVPGGPNTGTKNPAVYAQKIASQILGVDSKTKLGSSDSSG
jgi:hypothetical protein